MHTWKIALVGAVLGVSLIVATAHYGPTALWRVAGDARAARETDSHRPIALAADPITPSDNAGGARAPGGEHGWGPFRTTDW